MNPIIKKFINLTLIACFCLFCINKGEAGTGIHGSKTYSVTGTIVNEYTSLTVDAAAGATSITVTSNNLNTNNRFPAALGSAGDLVMIIQMQGASINTTDTTSINWGDITNYNNVGKFEFAEVSGISGSTVINLSNQLLHSYTITGKVQVIRVPRLSSLTVSSTGTIVAPSWNGSTGGVVTIEVNGATTINGTINVSGLGFRGGILKQTSIFSQGASFETLYASKYNYYGGEKGESIAGDTTIYKTLGGRYGRGAPANGGGGGNDHNAAGGGGSNGNNGVTYTGFGNPDTTTSAWIAAWNIDGAITHTSISSGGGRGGYSYADAGSGTSPYSVPPGNGAWQKDNRDNVGGHGGRPLNNSYNGGNLVFMGGGGGAGDANDGDGSGGANGGGIIYLLSGGTISGSGTLNASGASADSSLGPDAGGGAGGGGSVIVYTKGGAAAGLTINTSGGVGGNQYYPNKINQESEGPGGGGGGGYVSLTTPNSFSVTNSGGHNGITNTKWLGGTFSPNGATEGATGLQVANPANPYSGIDPLPITLLSFAGVEKGKIISLSWITAAEINNNYFTISRSADGINYAVLGYMNGAGTSNSEHTYFLDDKDPQEVNYYRLKQTDYDGRTETFGPIYIKRNAVYNNTTLIAAGPIPFTDHITIDLYVHKNNVQQLSVYNMSGQVVRSFNIACSRGVNSFLFNDLNTLNAGIYFLHITGESTSISIKAIKE